MSVIARGEELGSRMAAEFERRLDAPFPVLLDSARPSHGRRGPSYLAADPFAVITARAGRVDTYRGGTHESFLGDPLEVLSAWLAECEGETVHTIGYFGYDLAAWIERLPRRAQDDQDFPELFVGLYDDVLVDATSAGRVERLRAERYRERALDPRDYAERFRTPPRRVGRNFTREGYLAAVERIKRYIAAGDIYQVNLSQRFGAAFEGRPIDLYHRLRRATPAPYAAYLGLGNRAVLSSSPEEFLTVSGRRVRTTPIKGTRPRGENEERDHRLREELWNSEKDAAELTMIVDLERNDLGKVCEPGTVRVLPPKRIEAHPTVWHLSASVTGELEAGRDRVDLLRACFPGGSVTGAPKIRAMEIIDRLEPTRRGVFTGAIGVLTPDGGMRSNIAIRTMQVHGDWASFQVGGAVVWDSDPEAEYRETLVKARGMAQALGLALEAEDED